MRFKILIAASLLAASAPAFACGGGRMDPAAHVKSTHERIDNLLAKPDVLRNEREAWQRFNPGKSLPDVTDASLRQVREMRAESGRLFAEGLLLRERAGRLSPGAEKKFNSADEKAASALELLGANGLMFTGAPMRCGARPAAASAS